MVDEKNKHLKPVLLFFCEDGAVEFHANLQLQMSGVKLSPLFGSPVAAASVL